MASLRGTRNHTGDNARQLDTEEIEPSHVWTEDLTGHYLLVDLPGIFSRAQSLFSIT